jgi:flagellar biosynthesis protein FlhA
MNSLKLPSWMNGMDVRAVAAPFIIVMLLSMMILPLPAIVLDVLFSFNIALSILVLLIGLQTKKALDFIAFPTVLLVTTMLRLSLNVASTRVVLTEGHTGPAVITPLVSLYLSF